MGGTLESKVLSSPLGFIYSRYVNMGKLLNFWETQAYHLEMKSLHTRQIVTKGNGVCKTQYLVSSEALAS